MLPILLSDIRVHGYLALWIIVFLGSAGVPLPCDPLLLAAGALAGHGELNIVGVALVAITSAAGGDIAGYLIGYKWGRRAVTRLERTPIGQRFLSAHTVERGRIYFDRYGRWAIFLSRWLIGAFSGVVNLLAGVRHLPFLRFLVYALAGELIDTTLMLGLGMAFGASLASANSILKIVSFAAIVLLGAAFVIVRLLVSRRRVGREEDVHHAA